MKIFYDVGPILRALTRQKTAFFLLVSEAALAFAVISTIIWVGGWYHGRGSVDPGYDVSALISVASMGGAERPAHADARREREMQVLSGAAGVVSVASISNDLMESRWMTAWPVRGAAGEDLAPEGVWVVDGAGPLAQTLGLKIIDGAMPADEHEVLISRSTAQAFFADRTAVGGALTFPDVRGTITVAGVYEDVALVIPYLANGDLTILRPRPTGDERGTRYLVRVDPADRGSVIATLVRELRQLDAQRAYDVRPFNLAQTRHVTTSSGLIQTLGIIALVLAAVALLGSLAITAFLVQQRTRQVGIRRALGATQWDIVHQFLIENGFAVALGCILGFAISLGYYFALGDVFPGVSLSAMQFLFTASLLFVDGALATLVPALRAARISPTTASRSL